MGFISREYYFKEISSFNFLSFKLTAMDWIKWYLVTGKSYNYCGWENPGYWGSNTILWVRIRKVTTEGTISEMNFVVPWPVLWELCLGIFKTNTTDLHLDCQYRNLIVSLRQLRKISTNSQHFVGMVKIKF